MSGKVLLRLLVIEFAMVFVGTALYFAFSPKPLGTLGAVLGVWGFIKALTQVKSHLMPQTGGGLTLGMVAVGLLSTGRMDPQGSLLLGLSLTFSGLLLGQVIRSTLFGEKSS